jgi:hypothetical protein
MEAACTSKMLATLPTSTECNDQRTQLTSRIGKMYDCPDSEPINTSILLVVYPKNPSRSEAL